MNTSSVPVRPFALLKLIVLSLLALALFFLNACDWVGVIEGNGHTTTEERPVTGFSKIEAGGAFTITWTPGPVKVAITTDENLLKHITTHVNGDTLKIEWEEPVHGTDGIKVNLSSPQLTGAQLNGATRTTATGLSGSEFYLEANGASRIVLSGAVNALSGELNGASKLVATDLQTRAMELSISGAGRADVNASEVLKVDISGAGKVTYEGNPAISKQISGAGSVKRRD